MPMFLKRFRFHNADAGAAGGGAAGGGQGGAGGAGGGASGGAAGGAGFDWNSIPDEGVRSWVTTKGFKDPGALAQSAWNLEKLMGVPQERIVKLPGDDKPESWQEIYNRLGRPETADGYKIPVPEGGNPDFAKTAAAWFHEAGLNQRQAEVVATKWNAFAAQQAQAQQAEMAVKGKEQSDRLKVEWGSAHDANIAISSKAAKTFGFTPEVIDKMQEAVGFDGVMKLMHAIGSKIGEDGFVVGDGGGSGGAKSPEGAKAEIQLLRKDGEFSKKLLAGDAEAKAKWTRLHQIAFPGDTFI